MVALTSSVKRNYWLTMAALIVLIYVIVGLISRQFIADDLLRNLVVRAIAVVLVVIVIVRKPHFFRAIFLRPWLSVLVFGLSAALVYNGGIAILNDYGADPRDLILYTISNFCTGIFEELLFRVIVFTGVLTFFGFQKEKFWKATLITALCFALMHLLNALRPGVHVLGVLNQVVAAFCLGVFFQVVFARTRNILIPVLLHFLFNFYGSRSQFSNVERQLVDNWQQFFVSLIVVIAATGIILLLSWLLHRKEAGDDLIEKLKPISG